MTDEFHRFSQIDLDCNLQRNEACKLITAKKLEESKFVFFVFFAVIIIYAFCFAMVFDSMRHRFYSAHLYIYIYINIYIHTYTYILLYIYMDKFLLCN